MAIYDNYYIEIATSCKATLAMTMCGYCHCERSEAIHKPQKVNTKNKKGKEFTILIPFCHCEGQRPVAIHKPQNPPPKNRKIKKFTHQ